MCWSKNVVLASGNWYAAQAACAGYTADGAKWRLPHVAEIRTLYGALGGDGGDIPAYTQLNQLGTGIDNGMIGGRVWYTWCAQWETSTDAYCFYASQGAIVVHKLTFESVWARCVRTL
ncbi:MAG: hypothetical protein LBG15_01455 [Dysgonamonadaceae bacterium]|nr:hypothetical protein [Dysgonamonadaceae bacterium]